MEALDNASQVEQEHEELLLKEQYEAMSKQKNKKQHRKAANKPKEGNKGHGTKDRAAGVAVLRTIVKQSQQQNELDVGQMVRNQSADGTITKTNDQKAEIINNWQGIAQKHMEEAALRYGHGSALVRLGNEALRRTKDSSDTTWLIDRDRCVGWMGESPLDLAPILNIGVPAEGTTTDEGSPSPYLRLALRVYEEAGRRGSAEGWYNLGHMLWEGLGDARDDEAPARAMEAFREAMKLGDADAMYFVASHYLSREEDDDAAPMLASTYTQLLSLLRVSAPDSLPVIEPSEFAATINDTQRNGYKLLHLAAHGHNHGGALHHLALLNIRDKEKFWRLLAKAAATGKPEALFLRGHCYHAGTDGHDRDRAAALRDFLTAAASDHVDAMVSAGALLHQGVVSDDGKMVLIKRDQQRAFDLYQRAGELGSVEGWRNVVSCYATGQGVPQCLETAKYIANTLLKDEDD